VPLFRSHGQFPYREVFNLAPENHPAYQSILYYDKLRYRLMPYIYSLAGKTYHDNYTIMRGLPMDFSSDEQVLSIGDQYMFGPSLLINPVYTYKARTKAVYLPATTGWYNLYTGTYEKGGKYVNADAPYERMPIFVKEGAILPFGPDIQYTAEKPADPITLYVYTGKDGEFTMYEDENTNYNYEKGAYATIPIKYNEASKTLTIGDRKGTFPGMLNERTFRIVWVTPTAAKSLDFDRKVDNEVKYSGKALSVKM
jgi:alpha-D-xyloside xylohydrolase